MKRILKSQLLIGLLVAAFVASSASAGMMNIPADPKTEVVAPINSILTGVGSVNSHVYQYSSGQYANKFLYTYQLTSTGPGISFFSIGINNTASLFLNVAEVNYDSSNVQPSNWTPVGSPLQSVDAGFFVTPVLNGQTSSLLWFVCDYSPIIGTGAVFGTSSGMPSYATGNLYTIPEPATICLLGLASVALLKRNKK